MVPLIQVFTVYLHNLLPGGKTTVGVVLRQISICEGTQFSKYVCWQIGSDKYT